MTQCIIRILHHKGYSGSRAHEIINCACQPWCLLSESSLCFFFRPFFSCLSFPFLVFSVIFLSFPCLSVVRSFFLLLFLSFSDCLYLKHDETSGRTTRNKSGQTKRTRQNLFVEADVSGETNTYNFPMAPPQLNQLLWRGYHPRTGDCH